MVWHGMEGLGREDLREQLERPVVLVRQALQVSQDSVRQRCVWLHRRTPRQDYRRQEQSKDPMFRKPSLHQWLTTPGGERERESEGRRERPLFCRTTSRARSGGQWFSMVTGCIDPHSLQDLTTWSFDWWHIMTLILHITMTTAAHSHPHPSEYSSLWGWCHCQHRPNVPLLFQQWERNR